jgi:hypothetical protein
VSKFVTTLVSKSEEVDVVYGRSSAAKSAAATILTAMMRNLTHELKIKSRLLLCTNDL